MSEFDHMREKLSLRGKNGIAFIAAASVIWCLITMLFFLPLDQHTQNIGMLFATGLMFRFALAASVLLKAEWKFDGHPLASLGSQQNVAQVMYIPLVLWAVSMAPSQAVLFLAVIVAAHFFPYGWLYNTRAFYVMSPVMVLMLFGTSIVTNAVWAIPGAMVVLLLLLAGWLHVDFRSKVKHQEERKEQVAG
ncbi:DUF7010 family protein [Alkalicoccus luteus]|uniref:Uncharacterized protein n=1 Tax=Alkalicoccus luteus TaxID=1237094 RepID=A0A969PWD3_9BACI|nr:hypothetical protein [Alkalicoccus luteus]NJP36857.1 hypothetical protein [Alkalicoccus luteus]